MFGRQATSPTLATNSRRSHADSQCREHDDYFGVARVTGCPGENFLADLRASQRTIFVARA